jgi:predicted CoA-binding protein
MNQNKKILVLGASKHTYRYSFMAGERLIEKGYDVTLVGKSGGEIQGREILKDLPQNGGYHTVTLYLSEENQGGYEDFLLSIRPARIIFNPGAENSAFSRKAEKAGIEILEACTLIMLSANTF